MIYEVKITSEKLDDVVVTIKQAAASTGGDEGGETVITEEKLTWTLGTKAYSEKAKINGASTQISVLKLGTSSAAGNATITLPAGTVKVAFTAVAWKGKKATLLFKDGTTTIASQTLVANTGASNSSPYTITVADTDTYEFEYSVDSDTVITLDTTNSTSGNQRAIVWDIIAYVAN